MILNDVHVPDEIAAILVERHNAQTEKITDKWEKVKQSIWSPEEIVTSNAQTLLRFFAEKRLILGNPNESNIF